MISRSAEPPRVPANPNVATAVLMATAPGGPSGVAAALIWEDTSILVRLLDQLASLGVHDRHVVARPVHHAVIAALLEDRPDVRVHLSADPAGDLQVAAAIAREGGGGIVLAHADVVTQREALAGLLADPRVATGILSTGGRIARPFGMRVRARRGRIVSAQSPFHAVTQPNSTFLGLLKVAAADRPRLAELADQLRVLRANPPEGWLRQLDVARPGMWKLALDRIARRLAEREAAGLFGEEGEDEVEAERNAIEAEAAAELDPSIEGDEEARERRHPDTVELSEQDTTELARRVAAMPQDVVSLLLVGLVRDGAQIGQSHLRSLFWARPLSEDAVAAARERIAEHDEDRALLESAVKANDGFFTTFFVSPYSQYIARWCARRGLTPNQVTSFSMLLGIIAAVCFATGERGAMVAGAIVLQLAFTFDCVDGQLARYTRTFSKLGAWLDSIFDRSKEYVVFAGLAIGAAHQGDPVWVLACAALTLQLARHFVDFSYPAAQHQEISAVPQPPAAEFSDGQGPGLPRWLREEEPLSAADLAADADASPGERPPVPLSLRILRLWRRLGRNRRIRWVKKVFSFPIGERFAAISVSAAIWDARVTFIVLLAWGGVAGAYILAGRILRSVRSSAFNVAPGQGPGRLETYRDDGPLARLIGRAIGGAVPLNAELLAAVGLAAVLLGAAIGEESTSKLAAGIVVGVAVLAGAVSAGRPHRDRLRWLVPPALRITELAGITWLAAIGGGRTLPAAFALLCAIAFRHYDNVYRLRQRGEDAADFVGTWGLGWDGRLLLSFVLVAASAVPAGFWVAAAAFASLFIGEAVHGWSTFNRAQRVPVYDDEEEEIE